MDHRDDWPDRVLEGDLDAVSGRGLAERRKAERIARDAQNMNAVLSAMADGVSERVPTPIHAKAAPAGRRPTWRWQTMAPIAAAAAITLSPNHCYRTSSQWCEKRPIRPYISGHA